MSSTTDLRRRYIQMRQAATIEDLDPNFIEGFRNREIEVSRMKNENTIIKEGYTGINKDNAWILYVCLAVVIVVLSFARKKLH
jgi:hypothetical protein